MSFTAALYCFVIFLATTGCDDNEEGILKIDEDKLRTLGSPRAQKEAVCRYLCGRGPVRVQMCFCRVDVTCMDSYCPKGKFCKSLDSIGKNLYACCPNNQTYVPRECKGPRLVLQVKSALRYYRYNLATRRCEEAYLYAKTIQLRNVPGYSTAQMCRTCTLIDFCAHPEHKYNNLESIFSFRHARINLKAASAFRGG